MDVTQLGGPNGRNQSKSDFKNRLNDGPATVWQILNMKGMQSQETEIMQTCWNLLAKFVKPHQVNSFCVRFKQFETTAMSALSSMQYGISIVHSIP